MIVNKNVNIRLTYNLHFYRVHAPHPFQLVLSFERFGKIKYNKFRKLNKGIYPQNKGQGQRHLVE